MNSKEKIIDAIRNNEIDEYNIDSVDHVLLASDEVLREVIENGLSLDFIDRVDLVSRKKELYNSIYKAMKETELGSLWDELRLISPANFDLYEFLSGHACKTNDCELDNNAFLIFHLIPGFNEVIKRCNNIVPTAEEAKVLSNDILKLKKDGRTIKDELFGLINGFNIYFDNEDNYKYNEIVDDGADTIEACKWVSTVIIGSMNKLEKSLIELGITSKMLSGVIKLVSENKLSGNNAKKILYRAIAEKKDPLDIIKEENLQQIEDDSLIVKLVNEALDENPNVVDQFKEGKDYVVNYFVGQVMKKTKGQANPTKTLEIVKEEIKRR